MRRLEYLVGYYGPKFLRSWDLHYTARYDVGDLMCTPRAALGPFVCGWPKRSVGKVLQITGFIGGFTS